MAEILRYIDTGSDAGGDGTTAATSSGDNTHAYQSLNAWEAAEETDLDTANNIHTVHCNRTNGGGTDAGATINGWTTSATDYITIMQDDFPVDGIYDSAAYQIVQTNATCLVIFESYVRVEKVQIVVTVTGTSFGGGISAQTSDAGDSDIRIDSCIIKGICNGTGGVFGINIGGADPTVTVFNTIMYGFLSGDNPADAGFRGLQISAGVISTYNCTISGNHTGLVHFGGTATAINCAVFNNTDDFSGTITVDYCATDEHAGGGTNGVDISGTWDTTCFTAPEASPPDFSVQDASSPVYQTGNGATPKGTFTDDIIDTTRDAVDLDWDIGAFELIVAAGGIVILRRRIGGY